MLGYYVDVMDVNNAFLFPDLEEDIYIEVPAHFRELLGIEVGPNSVLKLNKASSS